MVTTSKTEQAKAAAAEEWYRRVYGIRTVFYVRFVVGSIGSYNSPT